MEKNVSMKICLSLFFFMMPHALYGIVDMVSTSSRLVLASEAIDEGYNEIIQVAIGVPVTDPTTWDVSTISAEVSEGYNTSPKVFSNAAGDVVLLWSYMDLTYGYPQVVAASLLSTSTTWNINVISDISQYAGQYDYVAHIDDATDVVVAWSSLDIGTSLSSAVVSTTNLSTSDVWSYPVVVVQSHQP
jgi:hypothetical protein